MDLQQKVMNAFIGKVVRKDLAFLVKGGLPVPTYVLEYLLGQYCASDDEEIINEGLEKVSNQVVEHTTTEVHTTTEDHTEEPKTKRPRISVLQEKSMSFRMGQTGVSYEKLFAPYMREAKEITIKDPYIRTSWQIKNFMEFALMLINTRPVDDLKLNLITNEEEDKIPDLIDKLDDIKDDLASYGIEFTYKFRDFHDRCIKTDTGWTITLGRGLDMFEKYSPYSIASSKQDMRKCKEFTATFMKNKNV